MVHEKKHDIGDISFRCVGHCILPHHHQPQDAELTLNPTGKTGSRCSSPGFGPSLWSRKKVSLAAADQFDKAKSEKRRKISLGCILGQGS
jgi:hypothetical protein